MKNFYDILVTDASCSSIEIKEAYEKLSDKFRLEFNPNDPYSENRFRQVSEAYEVLGDPEKRKKYDEELSGINTYPTSKNRKEQRYYTKAIDITFTIVLIFFTVLFGDYVINSIRSHKKAKVKKIRLVSAIPPHKVNHHKKKHNGKINAAVYFPKFNPKTIKANPIVQTVQTPVNDNVVVDDQKAEPAKNISLDKIPENDLKKQAITKNINLDKIAENDLKKPPITENSPSFPYATYIFSNETGVVNMRKFDSYGSAIIKVIPTKSEVFVLEKGSTYYKVQFDNSIGYVPKWSVQTK